jgi:hypothetical protein
MSLDYVVLYSSDSSIFLRFIDSFHCFFETGLDLSEEDGEDKRSTEKAHDIFADMDPAIFHRQNRLLVNNVSLESKFVKIRNENTHHVDFEKFGIDAQVLS